MLQDYYADREPEQVASVFGTRFAQALFRLKPGAWRGPVESGLGWHLVFVESIAPGRVPTFEEIETDVKAQWVGEQRAESKRRTFDAMRARYELRLPAIARKIPVKRRWRWPRGRRVPGMRVGLVLLLLWGLGVAWAA